MGKREQGRLERSWRMIGKRGYKGKRLRQTAMKWSVRKLGVRGRRRFRGKARTP